MRRGKNAIEVDSESEKARAKKMNVWVQNYSAVMDNSTSSQHLEDHDKKFPSTFDIQGFQSAKVTTGNKIPKPIISARKRIFHMEETSQKSKESSIK